jgi:hypothetical protein
MNAGQTPQEYFRLVMLTVMGQALDAAGYTLDDRPTQWAGGMFRFIKPFDDGTSGVILIQLLSYVVTEFAELKPSRFRVSLMRGAKQRTLSALVVEDFGVAILPSADHWWTFNDVTSLGKALVEAGHLIIGYGIPWLAGELTPDEENET